MNGSKKAKDWNTKDTENTKRSEWSKSKRLIFPFVYFVCFLVGAFALHPTSGLRQAAEAEQAL